MILSSDGGALIHAFETLELRAYPDPGSPLGKECTRRGLLMRDYERVVGWSQLSGAPWTIGWGHTGADVSQGLEISADAADSLFAQDIGRFIADVNQLLDGQEVDQNEFDALVSFAYNVGSDIDADDDAEGLGDSTLLKKLKRGDMQGAADEFLKWNKAGGQVMRGLKRRRSAERAMFLDEDWRAFT